MRWFLRYTYTERGGAGLGGNSTEEVVKPLEARNAEDTVAEARRLWEAAKQDAEGTWSMQDLRDAELVLRLL